MKNRKKIYWNFITVGMLIVILSGCGKVGPEYHRQPMEMDSSFEDTVPKQMDPAKIIRVDWWKDFGDDLLDRFVQDAISGSYDLKMLLGKIKAAGAMVDESEASLYPSLDFETGASLSTNKDEQSFKAMGALNWELDLWGKNRRKAEAAKAEQQAIKAEYRAGYLSLVSNVALAYFTIRQYDAMEALAKRFIQSNDLVLTIYSRQLDEGLVSNAKVLRQRAQLNTLRQERLEMHRGRTVQEHKLAALLGRPPGKIKVAVDTSHRPPRLPDVPVGLPSDLLNRRPDILAAEYRLIKASHQIGIAEADRLPSIRLTAQGGLASAALSSLLSGGVLSFLPTISLPILDAGRRKAEVEKSKYEFEIARNNWAKTANNAFKEVADALTNLSNHKKQRRVVQARVDEMKKIRAQLNARLQLGLVSQLEFIDIDENLFAAKKEKIKLDTLLINDTIQLYKALGGGWPLKSSVQ